MKRTLALLLAIGCSGSELDIAPRVAPADGQTDVGAFQPLELEGYGLDYPSDHPIPAFVTVVQADTLAPVAGTLELTEIGTHFVPQDRWAENTAYLVTVSEPLEDSRAPGFRLPVDDDGVPYQGLSSFTTQTGARPLQLLVSGDRFCLIASQPLLPADLQGLQVDRGGVRVAPTSVDLLDPEAYEDEVPFGEDRGLGVVCGPGDGVERAWLGEVSVRSSGAGEVADVVRDLRRFR